MYRLVVSRGHESPDWLAKEPASKYDSVVYDGPVAIDWLSHIIASYDNLPEHTVFLRGRPADHMGRFEEVLGNLPASSLGLEGTPGCRFLSDSVVYENHLDTRVWDGKWLRLHPADMFRRIFRNDPPGNFAYAPGGQYIVHRGNISNKPVGFYRRALHEAERERFGSEIFERLWPLVFDAEDRWISRND